MQRARKLPQTSLARTRQDSSSLSSLRYTRSSINLRKACTPRRSKSSYSSLASPSYKVRLVPPSRQIAALTNS